MSDEEATRAYMWIRVWLNREPKAYAGEDVAPLLEELSKQVRIQMLWDLMGVEAV